MKTKWILLVGIIVVVCLIGVGAYFFLVFSPLFFISDYRVGPSLPPVDISGITISSALTAEELLPDQLINESLNRETVDTSAWWGIRDGDEYNARETSAEYNGITLRVFKAETEVEAPTVFRWYFDNPFKEHVSGWRKGTGTAWWFTYEGEGTSSFAWISGVWIFGVEAGNAEARNQAAAEWVQELRGY